jgi:hypothetical protein
MMPGMLGRWLRRLFSSESADDDAADLEEYGLTNREQRQRGATGFGSFAAGAEEAEAAEDELDEFKPPPDPAP